MFARQMFDVVTAPEMHHNFGARGIAALCVNYFGRPQRLDFVLFDQITQLDDGPRITPFGLGLGHRSTVDCP